jgi:hypothetical protein
LHSDGIQLTDRGGNGNNGLKKNHAPEEIIPLEDENFKSF